MLHKGYSRSNTVFRIVTVLFLLPLLALLIWALTDKSDHPQLLGRYSVFYAFGLLGLTLCVAFLVWCFWRPRPFLIRWVGNVYMLVISTVVAIICAESALRLLDPRDVEYLHLVPYQAAGMVSHPQLAYVNPTSVSYNLAARHVHLNFHGLRMDDDIPYDKPVGEKRILVLGDSVAFGAAVNQGETFSDRLERLLHARTGEVWHVINTGVNGYNSEQEATYLRIEGMRYTPDVVILVYVPNDTSPKDTLASHHRYWYRFPDWPSPKPALPSGPRELFDRVLHLSLGYTLVRMNLAEISKEKFSSITEDAGWAYSRAWLEDAANQCNARAVPFLVALYRGKDEKFLADLSSSGIDAISLEPAWRNVPPDKRQPSRLDPHPSAAVHAEMAVVLLQALQVRGWLASPSDDRRHLK